MPHVELLSENEGDRRWTFDFRIQDGEGPAIALKLNLSWADYNLWTGDGSDAPHAVAEAVVRYLLSHLTPRDLPQTIDASFARRQFADADREIPGLIRRESP